MLTDDVEVAVEDGFRTNGIPDGVEVTEDGLAAPALLLGRERRVINTDGVIEIAELVKEAALFGGSEVDGGKGSAETGAAVIDDEFESVFAADAQGLEIGEEGKPGGFVFVVSQAPGQDFCAIGVRPDAESAENGPFAALFARAAATFGVKTVGSCRHQLRHPDGIDLQNGSGRGQGVCDRQFSQLLETAVEGAQP